MGVFDMIHSFLNPQEGYQGAEDQLTNYWNQAKGFQQPYMDNANAAYPGLRDAMDKLMNPGQLENDWASGYQTSPYAQQMLKQNQASGLDAASSMGLNGSSAALGNIQTGAGNIVNQDRQQYMQDLMQKFLSGIGLGQDIYGKGASAANQMSQQAGQMGENMAQMKFGELNSPGNTFENIMGFLAKLGQGGFGPSGSGNFAPASAAVAS